MRLHVFEWGAAGAPALVCLHGASGHGQRFRQLAEERWAAHFRVVAPDLRGHGRSGWEPPWTIETYVDDLVETVDSLGLDQPLWVGHSFGGRLVLELAARHPERIRRVVLLDPAIELSSAQTEAAALYEQAADPIWDSVEACLASRNDAGGSDERRALADLALQLELLGDGRLRRRTSQEALVAIYRSLATKPPSPQALTMPTLLLYAPAAGIVTDAQAAAYGRDGIATVSGGHMVMWSAFDETADAVANFQEAR